MKVFLLVTHWQVTLVLVVPAYGNEVFFAFVIRLAGTDLCFLHLRTAASSNPVEGPLALDFQEAASKGQRKVPAGPPFACLGPGLKVGVNCWDKVLEKFIVVWHFFLHCKMLHPCDALSVLSQSCRLYVLTLQANKDFENPQVQVVCSVASILLATDWEFDGSSLTKEEETSFLKLAGVQKADVKTAQCHLVTALGSC